MSHLQLVRAVEDVLTPKVTTRRPSTPAPATTTIETISAREIAKPLPSLPYLVKYYGLASGAPCVIGGYGFSAKTMFTQYLALCVAAGRRMFGVHDVKQGRVLHLDYEQGKRVCNERYQRLARGMGIDLPSLDDSLRLAVMPDVRLDHAGAVETFRRALEGVALVIVDSLKAATDTDENDSRIRNGIDALNRAGEPHGTHVMLIHHARKPKEGEEAGSRYGIRGSSAVFDACGSVFTFAGERGKPTRVSHQKCRNRGLLVEDFGFEVRDVAKGSDARWGLSLEYVAREALPAPAGTRKKVGL